MVKVKTPTINLDELNIICSLVVENNHSFKIIECKTVSKTFYGDGSSSLRFESTKSKFDYYTNQYFTPTGEVDKAKMREKHSYPIFETEEQAMVWIDGINSQAKEVLNY